MYFKSHSGAKSTRVLRSNCSELRLFYCACVMKERIEVSREWNEHPFRIILSNYVNFKLTDRVGIYNTTSN